MTKLFITADYDYIQGHLRYGHAQVEVDKDFWEEMTPEEQRDYFRDNSDVIVDDYEIDDMGELGEFQVQELNEDEK